ncbi:MAG: hypothetical protein HYV09_06630 [Deltaproteobacteria bacterium]|nr:hypothetical protein [Deltaproteobacteria bacterium]
MVSKRLGHGLVALSSTKALLVGGSFGTGTLSTAELWDATTGTFATTCAMGAPRVETKPHLLSTGKVLVAGGSTTTGGTIVGLSTAELYDPVAGTFAATGSMARQRRSNGIAPVVWTTPPGKPVIYGGVSGAASTPAFETYSTAEAYDTVGGTSIALSPTMAVPRRGLTATPLASGAVLIAGGGSTSAEIHTTTGTYAATAAPMATARTYDRPRASRTAASSSPAAHRPSRSRRPRSSTPPRTPSRRVRR